ncbi:histone-lysine n-methyltransferase suv39h1 [Stylonychia lemnae]|uniref:Histone-lysine n-methyltransferase suv39h1 n=1 Tax=Stylonychia lemnae TaxID=5949 RepID=A0A078AA00_STYLE|nr:histone-lysine n-methyltransferase suv39h1 [Stylonychia lemnae]|eukprot:CDW79095.1 histone-lysine n-methyltransferase suv39h1 [Stylonychia lemnae]
MVAIKQSIKLIEEISDTDDVDYPKLNQEQPPKNKTATLKKKLTAFSKQSKSPSHRKDDGSYQFLSIDEDKHKVIEHLTWSNDIDDQTPYQINCNSDNQLQLWKYSNENLVKEQNIQKYIKNKARKTFCKCTDGCQTPKKCACYKYNKSLLNRTYEAKYHHDNTMIAIQNRAIQRNNKTLTFNECHPKCACNKDLCQNFLMHSENKHKWKGVIKRVKKQATLKGVKHEAVMWGLFSLELIPAGAYVVEYVGEVITAKEGDKRGKIYDQQGMSYLFDMNDPDESDDYDMKVQESGYGDFFPLCLDAAFLGNESRFVNHCCDPNLKPFNIVTEIEGHTYHKIVFFATKHILPGYQIQIYKFQQYFREEMTIDYKWDKNLLNIPKNVPCLCEKQKCRKYLIRSFEEKQHQDNSTNQSNTEIQSPLVERRNSPNLYDFLLSDTLSEDSNQVKKKRIKKKVFKIHKQQHKSNNCESTKI